MEVQDGAGVSSVTDIRHDLDMIRLRNASHYNMTGSHKSSERLASDNSVNNNYANGYIFSDMPEDDEMDTEVKRLCSFKDWPASSPIKPKDLAAAGFYCVGRDDQVRCFRCDLTLRKWEEDDVPMEEHKRHRPMCPFVREESERLYQVTCQPVEASSSSNSPKISFQNKEISVSQEGYSMASGFSSSKYPSKYSTTNTGSFESFDRQEKRYDLPGSWRYFQHESKTSHIKSTQEPQLNQENTQTERNNPSYPSKKCYANESSTTSQELSGKESHLSGQPTPGTVGYYAMARPEKNWEPAVVEKPISGYPQENYPQYYSSSGSALPGRPVQTHLQGNTRLELSNETVSYKLYPGSTVNIREEEGGAKEIDIKEAQRPVNQVVQGEQKLALQPPSKFNISSTSKEQQWLKPRTAKIIEESPQHQNPRQPFLQPGVAQFMNQKPQDMTSTAAQGIYWPSGRPATQTTERVGPVSSLTTGTIPPGSLHQGTLYRQEDVRHVSSVAELQSEHHRLTTFVDWPQNSPIHPWELAAAGFYYLGNGDNVECFKCGRGLCNWDPDDTPWGEHAKWSPSCPLVIEHFQGRGLKCPVEGTELPSQQRAHDNRPLPGAFQQTQSAPLRLQSVPSGHSRWQAACPRENTQNSFLSGLSAANVSVGQRPHSSQSPLAGQVFTFSSPTTVTHPSGIGCYESSADPHSTPQSTVEMGTSPTSQPQSLCLTAEDINHIVEMGFNQAVVEEVISTQLANTGRTFASVDELTNAVLEYGRRDVARPSTPRNSATPMSGLSPTVQSPVSTWPVVPTVGETSSTPASYDHATGAGPNPNEQRKESLRRTHSAPQTTAIAASAPESVEHESLEKKLERMQEERTCKICMDAEIGIVFLPCGHLVCCPNCASGVELCPMCRSPIHDNVRTYMS